MDSLWDIRACANFIRKSPRWLWSALRTRPEEPGSIPHVYIGKTARFVPADIEKWVQQGCPPAATFAEWRRAEEKRPKSRLRP
jgi:hypothetical protein